MLLLHIGHHGVIISFRNVGDAFIAWLKTMPSGNVGTKSIANNLLQVSSVLAYRLIIM